MNKINFLLCKNNKLSFKIIAKTFSIGIDKEDIWRTRNCPERLIAIATFKTYFKMRILHSIYSKLWHKKKNNRIHWLLIIHLSIKLKILNKILKAFTLWLWRSPWTRFNNSLWRCYGMNRCVGTPSRATCCKKIVNYNKFLFHFIL